MIAAESTNQGDWAWVREAFPCLVVFGSVYRNRKETIRHLTHTWSSFSKVEFEMGNLLSLELKLVSNMAVGQSKRSR